MNKRQRQLLVILPGSRKARKKIKRLKARVRELEAETASLEQWINGKAEQLRLMDSYRAQISGQIANMERVQRERDAEKATKERFRAERDELEKFVNEHRQNLHLNKEGFEENKRLKERLDDLEKQLAARASEGPCGACQERERVALERATAAEKALADYKVADEKCVMDNAAANKNFHEEWKKQIDKERQISEALGRECELQKKLATEAAARHHAALSACDELRSELRASQLAARKETNELRDRLEAALRGKASAEACYAALCKQTGEPGKRGKLEDWVPANDHAHASEAELYGCPKCNPHAGGATPSLTKLQEAQVLSEPRAVDPLPIIGGAIVLGGVKVASEAVKVSGLMQQVAERAREVSEPAVPRPVSVMQEIAEGAHARKRVEKCPHGLPAVHYADDRRRARWRGQACPECPLEGHLVEAEGSPT